MGRNVQIDKSKTAAQRKQMVEKLRADLALKRAERETQAQTGAEEAAT